jgi:hypothetical protein
MQISYGADQLCREHMNEVHFSHGRGLASETEPIATDGVGEMCFLMGDPERSRGEVSSAAMARMREEEVEEDEEEEEETVEGKKGEEDWRSLVVIADTDGRVDGELSLEMLSPVGALASYRQLGIPLTESWRLSCSLLE